MHSTDNRPERGSSEERLEVLTADLRLRTEALATAKGFEQRLAARMKRQSTRSVPSAAWLVRWLKPAAWAAGASLIALIVAEFGLFGSEPRGMSASDSWSLGTALGFDLFSTSELEAEGF
jgi:hypothetical protein